MFQTPTTRGEPVAHGHMWTFVNDTRVVGELTHVFRTIASGTILEGWATITAYRSRMSAGAVHGMCVIGPVFDTVKRGHVLDLHPIFMRRESAIAPLGLSVTAT